MASKLVVSVGLSAVVLALGVLSSAACGTDDNVTIPPPDAGPDVAAIVNPQLDSGSGPGKVANGTACALPSECQSGYCSDGVCCDTSCNGVCESCKLAGSTGTCTAVPDGQDPDVECQPGPAPDAGALAGDAASDAGPFSVPDGGLPATTASQCAGHCNGSRACAFAGSGATCGTAFCGDEAEEGVATCDGAGHCLYGVEECSAFACPDGSPGCKTSCIANSDCLAPFYCDGATQTCKPKLANGTTCTTPVECQSDVCDPNGRVCCNIDCSSTTGGSCNNAGAVGTCECSACATGPCAVYYRDADNDGHGDVKATIDNGGAKYGCADAAPNGYVASHDDCFDSAAVLIAKQVHPGQTDYFVTAYTASAGGTPSFDYDCSGQAEKELAETSTCLFCAARAVLPPQPEPQAIVAPPPVCLGNTMCSADDQQAGHACTPNGINCVTDNSPSFTTTVDCGASAPTSTCGTCVLKGGTTAMTPTGNSARQACH